MDTQVIPAILDMDCQVILDIPVIQEFLVTLDRVYLATQDLVYQATQAYQATQVYQATLVIVGTRATVVILENQDTVGLVLAGILVIVGLDCLVTRDILDQDYQATQDILE